jgi:hypothetical protein
MILDYDVGVKLIKLLKIKIFIINYLRNDSHLGAQEFVQLL